MIFLDRTILFCLCACIFLLPGTIAGVMIFSSIAAILFVIQQFIGVLRKERPRLQFPPEVLWPAMLFLLFCGASIFWSVTPFSSARAFVGKILLSVVLLVCVAKTISTPQKLAWFMGSFLVSAALVVLDGFWQLWKGADLFVGMLPVDGRLTSVMKHPNDLGAYLIFVILPVLALALWSRTKHEMPAFLKKCWAQGAIIVLLLLLCLIMGLTYSRGAWLGFLISIVVFVVTRRQHILICLALLTVFFIVFSPLMTMTRKASFISDNVDVTRPLEITRALSEFTGSDRLNLWKDALKIIQDHPLRGAGLNTYTTMIYKYSEYRKMYPHNCYLHMAAELGLVGLGLFLWFVWAVGRFVIRSIALDKGSLLATLLAAFFAAWAGFLLESSLDTTLYSVQLSKMFWIMTGLMVAMALMLQRQVSGQREV